MYHSAYSAWWVWSTEPEVAATMGSLRDYLHQDGIVAYDIIEQPFRMDIVILMGSRPPISRFDLVAGLEERRAAGVEFGTHFTQSVSRFGRICEAIRGAIPGPTPEPKVLPDQKECIRCRKPYTTTEGLPDGAECPHCYWPRMRQVEEVEPETHCERLPCSDNAAHARRRAAQWTTTKRQGIDNLIKVAKLDIARMHAPLPQEEVELHWKLIESLKTAGASMAELIAYLENVAE